MVDLFLPTDFAAVPRVYMATLLMVAWAVACNRCTLQQSPIQTSPLFAPDGGGKLNICALSISIGGAKVGGELPTSTANPLNRWRAISEHHPTFVDTKPGSGILSFDHFISLPSRIRLSLKRRPNRLSTGPVGISKGAIIGGHT